ncbi:MAG: PBP1A family penicillin-binding protein [Candidatus Zophobacter franzmannii]|nr:PBP1A family penicillin-binding protein [Candidatus Zophobacter franzmannii]
MFFGGIVLGIPWYYSDEMPPVTEMRNYHMAQGSEVYDRYNRLIHMFAFEKRTMAFYQELPPYLIDALIATEDKNFYTHFGIDLKGTSRAFLVNVSRGGRFSQGASTITQQLARALFLTQNKKLTRKIKEAMLALVIERNFSKSEILEMYFNKVYFGGGVYGVETAAVYYFKKHASELSLPEAATLAGILQIPNYLNPIRHPERAIKRRNVVLRRMMEESKISQEQYEWAKSAPLIQERTPVKNDPADYFLENIRLKLERKYGTQTLFEGGLKIYTTIDYDLTQYADSVMNEYLTKYENNRNYTHKYADFSPTDNDIKTPYLQGGLVTMEAETGEVLAMLGGRNHNHSKFNRMVLARRSPGSAIKPVLYTAALEKGYTPATIIQDNPTMIKLMSGQEWRPHNYRRNRYYGYCTMRKALANSHNIWAVKALYDIGASNFSQMALRFGLTTGKHANMSSALGTTEVKPINLIASYSTFPNNGWRVKPKFILRVEDRDGKILEEMQVEKNDVCNPEVAYVMTSMLESVVNEGSGWMAKQNGMSFPVAGKTGTTDNYKDAWFIGFNKKLITGIWIGFDSNVSMGNRMSGGVVCAPPWSKIMLKTIINQNHGMKPKSHDARYRFVAPENIVKVPINPVTGFLAFNEENAIDEIFIDGTEPKVFLDSSMYNFYPTQYEMSADSICVLVEKPVSRYR